LIVLVSGAVLMGVEIAGAKIMAPGFGTSIFVWGSIIGLFMSALAAGYYLGGMLADRHPTFGLLAGIVTAAGVLTALIPRFGPGMCETIARQDIGPIFGPFLAAAAVFFLPSFLMGMVSPMAVKLNATSLAGLGGVAGRLYALSTFGSIMGTLLTTFVLVPRMGVSHVFQALGIILFLAAAIALALFSSGKGRAGAVDRGNAGVLALLALAFAEAWIVLPVEPYVPPGQRLLHYEDSSYHEILVTEDVMYVRETGSEFLAPVVWQQDHNRVRRWLKFNENIESGVFPYSSEYKNAVNYTDLLHLPLIWVNNPLPKRILVVGGGGGVIPTQFSNWYNCQVDVAELDGAVERVAKEYFGVPPSPNITFYIGDGRQTLRRTLPDGAYDIVFLDAYSSGGQIPFHLLTWEFLSEVKAKLNDRGILLTNIISGVKNVTAKTAPRPADLFLAEYKTLQASKADVTGNPNDDKAPLFNQVYVFPKIWPGYPMVGDAYEEYRNVIVVATREQKARSIEELADALKPLIDPAKPVIKASGMLWHVEHLYTKGPTSDDLASVPVLRDDYAPVDTMYRAVKRDEYSRTISLDND
jgi:predicted membrane-bound spermidine synthase